MGPSMHQLQWDGIRMSSKYTVRVWRAGKYWELHVDGVGVTQSRNLGADAEEMIRNYIATITGEVASLIDVEVVE